jgi:uncharacterized protein (TIGR03437 family)
VKISSSNLTVQEFVGASQSHPYRLTIGGNLAPTLYAGPHSALAGVDQVDIALHPLMHGIGESDLGLVADGYQTNTVQLNIQ